MNDKMTQKTKARGQRQSERPIPQSQESEAIVPWTYHLWAALILGWLAVVSACYYPGFYGQLRDLLRGAGG